MATVAQLRAVDEAHRQRQAANAAAVALAVKAAYGAVVPTSLARSGVAWMTQVISIILSGRRRSALNTLAYTQQIRTLQLPAEPRITLPPIPDELPGDIETQIRESLIYVGLKVPAMELARTPGKRTPTETRPDDDEDTAGSIARDNASIAREDAGIDSMVADVMARAADRVEASTIRHVQNGGRDALDTVLLEDRKARGYIRITRDDPCFFCAMLASRGPVFAEDSFDLSDPRFDGPGEHKVHDRCGCTLRPVYTRDGTEWTPLAREASSLWEKGDDTDWDVDASGLYRPPANLSGAAARREFRRLWEIRNAGLRAA